MFRVVAMRVAGEDSCDRDRSEICPERRANLLGVCCVSLMVQDVSLTMCDEEALAAVHA